MKLRGKVLTWDLSFRVACEAGWDYPRGNTDQEITRQLNTVGRGREEMSSNRNQPKSGDWTIEFKRTKRGPYFRCHMKSVGSKFSVVRDIVL